MKSDLLAAEAATMRAFVDGAHRDRWLMGLDNPTRRMKLLDRLCHHDDWDERYARTLRVPNDRERVAFI